jgi:hypothetical protein
LLGGGCRREGIASNLSYRWSKGFLEAGAPGPDGIDFDQSPPDEWDAGS